MELVLIVATIAQRFRLEWGADRPTPMASITLRPTGGLEAFVRRR
jgi:cytochrome P450